jgi:hypothetical protein
MRWLDNYGETVTAQLKARSSLGPNSISAVEATLRQSERAFHGRSQSCGNRARLNLLLALMVLHQNGDADDRRWADRLRERLHPRGGVPPRQRPTMTHATGLRCWLSPSPLGEDVVTLKTRRES